MCVCAGNYRTQLYDKQKEEYLPATQGLGMFVEVKDPDEKVTGSVHHITVITAVVGAWLKRSVSLAGDPVSAVRLGGTLHLHITHTRRASDLSALQLLQVLAVCRRHAGEEAPLTSYFRLHSHSETPSPLS